MKVLSVSWDYRIDDTKITFSDDFIASDFIIKADVLKDCIGMLTEQYNMAIAAYQNNEDFCYPKNKVIKFSDDPLDWNYAKGLGDAGL
jgi:hypothetical protein